MKLLDAGLQKRRSSNENFHPKDFLWLNIRDLPYFRSLLRAVEAQFYQEIDLAAPTLDIGCGEGHFAELTFDRNIDAGIDPWRGPIREAKTRQVYRLLTEADAGRMPYPDGYFASAFSNSVLEHIPHVEQVLSEAARVLKQGGLFVFCVPNHRFNENLSIAAALDKLRLRRLADMYRSFFTFISRHRHLDSPETWKSRLEQAGFVVERWWHYFPPRALAMLEWGHYFGLPSLIIRKLTGRWILVPASWNLMPIYRLLEPHAKAVASEDGVCTFYIARRIE
ncbi:MAG TPA: methyltransferase domain-containing protein [Anaerolineales bacterium]|nr:methyltransferase domain-containing protein [Anaerolineales bacterium]